MKKQKMKGTGDVGMEKPLENGVAVADSTAVPPKIRHRTATWARHPCLQSPKRTESRNRNRHLHASVHTAALFAIGKR